MLVHTDIAVLVFILLLSAVLYLPRFFISRSKRSHPKVTNIEEFRATHRDRERIRQSELNKKRLP